MEDDAEANGDGEEEEDDDLEDGPSLLYDTYVYEGAHAEAAAARMRKAVEVLEAQGSVVRDVAVLQGMHAYVAQSFHDWVQTPSRNAVGVVELQLEALANTYVAHLRSAPDAPHVAAASDADAGQFIQQAGGAMRDRGFARSLADGAAADAFLRSLCMHVHAICRPDADVAPATLARALMVGVRLVQWAECVTRLVREAPSAVTEDSGNTPLPAAVERTMSNPPRTLVSCALALFVGALLPPYAIGLQMRNGARRATPWADANSELDDRTRQQYNWCRARYDLRDRRWLTDEEAEKRAAGGGADDGNDPLRLIRAVPVDTIVQSQHAAPIELVAQMRHEERRRALELERMEPATDDQKRLYEDCLVLSAWAHAVDGALAAGGHTGTTEDRMPYCLLQCAAFSWLFGSNQARAAIEHQPYCRATAGTEYTGPAVHGVRRLPVLVFVTPFFYTVRCGVCRRTTWHARMAHAVAAWAACLRQCHRNRDGYGCKIGL